MTHLPHTSVIREVKDYTHLQNQDQQPLQNNSVSGSGENIQLIHLEHVAASQLIYVPHIDTQERSHAIFVADNWNMFPTEEIVETSSLGGTESTQYSFMEVESNDIEVPNRLTPPPSISPVSLNETMDMSHMKSSSKTKVPNTLPLGSNTSPQNFSEISQPGCSLESFAQDSPVNIKCVGMEYLLQHPSYKQENANEGDDTNYTEWSHMHEELDIPFQHDIKEQTNLYHANQIIKQFQQQSNQPKVGILGRQTYNKNESALKIKSSKKHCKKKSAPYSIKSESDIKVKTCYDKNKVKFINEDNELVTCKYKPTKKQNFDNLASNKFPKLTVKLIRIEETKLNINCEDIFDCDFCFTCFSSACKLVLHLEQIKCRKDLTNSVKNVMTSEENLKNTIDTKSCVKVTSDSKIITRTNRRGKKEIRAEADSSDVKWRTPDQFTENEEKFMKDINALASFNSDTVDVVFICKLCYTSFKTADALFIHKHKYHFNKLYDYVSKIFPQSTVKSESLEDVSVAPVKKECKSNSVTASNECCICGFKAVTTCHLEFHMKLHVNSHTKSLKQDKKEMKRSKSPIPSSSKVSTSGQQVEHLNSFDFKSMTWYPMMVSHNSQPKVFYNTKSNNNKKSKYAIKTVPRYVCIICSKMYRKMHSFNDHSVRKHVALINKTELLKIIYINPLDDPFEKTIFGRIDKKYKCHVCGVSLKSKLEAQNHMITFHCEAESD